MKLNTAQVKRTVSQLQIEALPETILWSRSSIGYSAITPISSMVPGSTSSNPPRPRSKFRRQALARLECWSMSRTGLTPTRPSSKFMSRN